ncbi:MAG: spore coat polysaccharide biosynthesis protein SpsF [Planctomycetota bacterium]|jgi:spore coat polysaccharide biosynthesis protein SpsF
MNAAGGSHSIRAVAGIQARMGSTRLPGKSLADLNGLPLIHRVFERAMMAETLAAVVVLTTVEPVDDPLAEYCDRHDIPCRRGSEQDVFARYASLMDELDPRYVARITGDCPFICPKHIDAQVEALEFFDADFAPAVGCEHIYPGQGVISARALRSVQCSQDPADREHVGSFWFAHHNDQFRSVAMHCETLEAPENLRLCVDEAADLEAARSLYRALEPTYGAGFPIEAILRQSSRDQAVREAATLVNHSEANQRIQDWKQTRREPFVGEWRR